MIILDYKDRRPIYEQITEKLVALILKGVLTEGSKLPSVRQLAMELSINPNTIQRAYGELEREGYIFSVKGKGSFVAESKAAKARKVEELFGALKELTIAAIDLGIEQEQFLTKASGYYSNRRDEND